MGKLRITLILSVLIPIQAEAQEAAAPAVDVAPSDTSRLVWGPTGRMLAPGQGYIAFDGIFIATVEVGVTRRFSMGGGAPMWPIFGKAHPVWITPKVQLYGSDRTNIAAGVVHMFVPGEARVGYSYVVGTFGSLEASITIAGGAIYFDDSDDRQGPAFAPLLTIGGERRYKPYVSFITENSLGPHGGQSFGGVRWRLTKWQINLGGLASYGSNHFFGGIWFGFARKFGGH